MSVDIVVPVYNGLHHVRSCLRSIHRFTHVDYHLIVVDDGSEPYVARETDALVRELWAHDEEQVTVLTNKENRGYLHSVNRGIRAGDGEHVVLLNSDTVVTPGWVQGLLRCLDSDDAIGIACPLASHANLTRLTIPGGLSFLDAAGLVRELSPARYPDIGLASGFCFIAARSLYDEIGLFDPLYGRGYYEESDLCMRALEAGLRVVADDATYIHHHGWGSFESEGRHEWMQRNRERFEERWGRAHETYTTAYLRSEGYAPLENALQRTVRDRGAAAAAVARRKRSRDVQEVLDDPTSEDLETHQLFDDRGWRTLAEDAARSARGMSGGGVPKVLYILPGLGAYGGVISVIQLVNRMLLSGFDAQIATYGKVDEAIYREPIYFRPYRFDSRRQMLDELPRYDLVVSTRWDTAYDALLLQQQWGCRIASFIQGFEAPHEPEAHQAAAYDSYRLIEHKIGKSRWMIDQLKPFGGTAHHIRLGLNLDVFYPAGEHQLQPPHRIVSAARPGVDVRNFDGTLEIMRRLTERRTDVLPTFFGKPFETDLVAHEHVGILNQPEVARLLRGSAVLLDASLEQSFGRPGIEAMACGVGAVLTTRGGINEYARDGINCLQVEPTDIEGNVAAIQRILDDAALSRRLRDGGFATAREYSSDLEADRTMELFRHMMR